MTISKTNPENSNSNSLPKEFYLPDVLGGLMQKAPEHFEMPHDSLVNKTQYPLTTANEILDVGVLGGVYQIIRRNVIVNKGGLEKASEEGAI